MKWRWWRTADEMAADFKANRLPEGDDKFFSDCGLPNSPLARHVSIAVRRSIAAYGMVESNYIFASDKYPDQLVELSGWDSVDFVGWTLELEQELGVQVPEDMFYGIVTRTFSVAELAGVAYAFILQHDESAEKQVL
jgi:acyl carrier protein